MMIYLVTRPRAAQVLPSDVESKMLQGLSDYFRGRGMAKPLVFGGVGGGI